MANSIINVAASAPYFEVLPSAARTATPDTVEVVVDRRGFAPRGLILVIDATAATATPSVVVMVQGVDRESGKLFPASPGILSSAAITGTGTTVLKIGPDIAASANAVALDYLPPVFRITSTHGDADSLTYSIGGMLI